MGGAYHGGGRTGAPQPRCASRRFAASGLHRLLEVGREHIVPSLGGDLPFGEASGEIDAEARLVGAHCFHGIRERRLALPNGDRREVESRFASGLFQDEMPAKSRKGSKDVGASAHGFLELSPSDAGNGVARDAVDVVGMVSDFERKVLNRSTPNWALRPWRPLGFPFLSGRRELDESSVAPCRSPSGVFSL